MAEASHGQTLNGINGAPVDTRTNLLYAEEQRPLSPREVWRLFVRSWRFIREYRRLVWTKAFLATVSLVFFLATPWPLKIVIDNVLDGRPLTGIPRALIEPAAGTDPARILGVVMLFLFIALLVVGMVADRAVALGTDVQSGGLDQAGFTQNDANEGWSLWNGLFGYLETRVTIDLTQRITQSVRTAVYRAFMTSPLGMYSDQKIGDAVFRVMHDSAAVSSVFYRGMLAPITSIIMFLMALIVLVAQFPNEPLIPALAALCLPVFAIFATLFGKALRNQSQEMRERGSNVMAEFEERLSQVQVIKAFGREAHESESIDRASWRSFRSTLRLLAIIMAIGIVLTPTVGFLMYKALYHTMMEVIAGRMTLGDVVLLAGYGALLAFPMATLGNTWAAMQLPAAGLRRIHSVLDRLQSGTAPGLDGDSVTSIRDVTFTDVSVGYAPGAPVLHSVSFQIVRGEMIALTGPSGTGKTTLILALPGFLEPIAGTISINGHDGRLLNARDLRGHVGFVFQQEALFSATIEENIRYGRLDASTEEVRLAAEKAGAAEFISQLSDGYSTMLGRRGTRLSVGQKQRIAIARALLAQSDVLILDEPTAPLDSASETNLIATLRAIARERIVLIVAHRPTTLAACDRVLFLHQGTLEASGTHASLTASSPTYRAYIAETDPTLRPQ
ncbi:MAG TPA: ABC transporter ATP-binding protein [Candidatus Binataceae bacterium]|nr:ABC transporter ATP-binding protein [Candidatus Binataceae bacterium]